MLQASTIFRVSLLAVLVLGFAPTPFMTSLSAQESRPSTSRAPTVSVVLGRPKPFAEMGCNERMLACYQHAGLRRVMTDFMTNQSLRARFGLAESASAAISRVLQDAVKAGLVRSIGPLDSDRKRRRYVPYWD